MTWEIRQGDALEQLGRMQAGSVQCCVTSPPYWGLRDYGNGGQLGLEPTPEEYVANMVAVFAEVRRVLRDDGTLWLNIGDSYAGGTAASGGVQRLGPNGNLDNQRNEVQVRKIGSGLKPKDLVGIPWMVAFALRADGWYLRSDIIWAKPNPMPESVTDRPTKAHEYLFLLTKSKSYFYDAGAIREEDSGPTGGRQRAALLGDMRYAKGFKRAPERGDGDRSLQTTAITGTRNKRSVWTVATQPFPGAHFATFPQKLIEPCILAGSAMGSTVLDLFCGAATTGVVAARLERDFIGIELNPDYVELGANRIRDDAPLFNVPAEK